MDGKLLMHGHHLIVRSVTFDCLQAEISVVLSALYVGIYHSGTGRSELASQRLQFWPVAAIVYRLLRVTTAQPFGPCSTRT